MSHYRHYTRRLVALASFAVLGLTSCDSDPLGPEASEENVDLRTFSIPAPINPLVRTGKVLIYRDALQLGQGATTQCVARNGVFFYQWRSMLNVSVRLESRLRGASSINEFWGLGRETAEFQDGKGVYGRVLANIPWLETDREYRVRLVENSKLGGSPRIAYSDWFRRADLLIDPLHDVWVCTTWT